MSRKARIEQSRLEQMEAEFETLLLPCLDQCSRGRWGLFGQNEHLDPEARYWDWPEARQLKMLATDIQTLRAEVGERNSLCDNFLDLCRLKGANVPGEPKLAAELLAEMEPE